MDLFLSATYREAEFLARWAGEELSFRGRRGLAGEGWVWLETGVGKVNAAMTLAAFLAENPGVKRVLVFGLAGSYPGTGLHLGELVLAGEEVQADLGTRRGMRPLGFPALAVGGESYYNRFPPDPGYTAELARLLSLRPLPLATYDLVSESPEEAHRRRQRWGAAAENMEGAAVAQAALWLGLPWAELRAISNQAGVRQKRFWAVDRAVDALARAFFLMLAD